MALLSLEVKGTKTSPIHAVLCINLNYGLECLRVLRNVTNVMQSFPSPRSNENSPKIDGIKFHKQQKKNLKPSLCGNVRVH